MTTRRYDSTLRRQRAQETHDRIVTAGCDLLAESSMRDWRALTMRAVAERAGVNERTVYRHFTNERGLRDSVMHRLEQRAGIDLDGLALEGIADVARRIFATVAVAPARPPGAVGPHAPATPAGASARRCCGRWSRTPPGGPRPTGPSPPPC